MTHGFPHLDMVRRSLDLGMCGMFRAKHIADTSVTDTTALRIGELPGLFNSGLKSTRVF